MTETLRIETRRFAELGPKTLYDLLALRAEVFVVEQVCPYLDLDGRDEGARHLLGHEDDRLVACARILEEDDAVYIGRIAVARCARGRGHGRALLTAALHELAGDPRPRLMHAQAQLEDFYASCGFARCGDAFLEDGIPHVLMRRDLARRITHHLHGRGRNALSEVRRDRRSGRRRSR